MRRLALLALAGCGIDLGSSGVWQPAAQITGDLAPSFGDAPAGAVPGATIRVVTYNIQDGGADPMVIASAFQGDPDLSRADLVLLQEEEAFPGATPRAAALAAALGMGWFYAPARPNVSGPGTFGNAILSRFPIRDPELMDLPHAPGKLQRAAIRVDVAVGALDVRVIDTQLDTTLNITKRILQLHPAVIDEPDATLVGGDFNTNPYVWDDGEVPSIPDSVVVDTDQAPLLDDYMHGIGFANQTSGDGPTEVRYGVWSRLDAVYVRGHDAVAGAVVRSISLSDHLPVWVDVRIAP